MKGILESTSHGLYCVPGDFHIDPHLPVKRAVVTHAHSDHARWGCDRYLATQSCEALLRLRMSPDAEFRFLPYGETLTVNGVRISFHPAGHILGSAQIRLEYGGHVVLITGDYKLGSDPTCTDCPSIDDLHRKLFSILSTDGGASAATKGSVVYYTAMPSERVNGCLLSSIRRLARSTVTEPSRKETMHIDALE